MPVENGANVIVPRTLLEAHVNRHAEWLLIRALQSVDRKGHIEIGEQELISQEARSARTIQSHLRILRKAGLISTRRASGKVHIQVLSPQVLREYWAGRRAERRERDQ